MNVGFHLMMFVAPGEHLVSLFERSLGIHSALPVDLFWESELLAALEGPVLTFWIHLVMFVAPGEHLVSFIKHLGSLLGHIGSHFGAHVEDHGPLHGHGVGHGAHFGSLLDAYWMPFGIHEEGHEAVHDHGVDHGAHFGWLGCGLSTTVASSLFLCRAQLYARMGDSPRPPPKA